MNIDLHEIEYIDRKLESRHPGNEPISTRRAVAKDQRSKSQNCMRRSAGDDSPEDIRQMPHKSEDAISIPCANIHFQSATSEAWNFFNKKQKRQDAIVSISKGCEGRRNINVHDNVAEHLHFQRMLASMWDLRLQPCVWPCGSASLETRRPKRCPPFLGRVCCRYVCIRTKT